MGLPSIVDDGQGDVLFEIGNQFLSVTFIGILQIGNDIQGLYAIGKRYNDPFEFVGVVFVHFFNNWKSGSGVALHFFLIVLVDFSIYFGRDFACAHPCKFLFFDRGSDRKILDKLELEILIVVGGLVGFGNDLTGIIYHIGDIDLKTLALQGMTPSFVDDLTLCVHYIIIFQQTFTHAEVVFLYFFLGAFYGFCLLYTSDAADDLLCVD